MTNTNTNQINTEAMLKEILPLPSNKTIVDRFLQAADEAVCRPDGKCSGKCGPCHSIEK